MRDKVVSSRPFYFQDNDPFYIHKDEWRSGWRILMVQERKSVRFGATADELKLVFNTQIKWLGSPFLPRQGSSAGAWGFQGFPGDGFSWSSATWKPTSTSLLSCFTPHVALFLLNSPGCKYMADFAGGVRIVVRGIGQLQHNPERARVTETSLFPGSWALATTGDFLLNCPPSSGHFGLRPSLPPSLNSPTTNRSFLCSQFWMRPISFYGR